MIDLLSRRAFLQQGGVGLGAIALGTLLNDWACGATSQATADPLAAQKAHFPARAKHVIYLHMIGAPSQLDLFDYKPELVKRDGQNCPEELTRGKRFAFIGGALSLAGTTYRFSHYG